MIKVESFGSVTVAMSDSGHSAVLTVHRPEELHGHEGDWNAAVRRLRDLGYEPPDDEPSSVASNGAETYVVALTRLRVVSA